MKLNPCKGTALLAAVLVFCTLFWGMAPLLPARAATKEDLQQQVEDAKQAYDDATAAQKELEKQTETTQAQIGQLEGEAAGIAAQLSTVYAALQQAQTELDAAQGEAEAAAAALEAKQAEYDTQWAEAREQLSAMQMLNDGGGIELLSQVTDLFELLNFARMLGDLSAYNDKLLRTLDAEAAALAEVRRQAEEAAARAEEARNTLQAQQDELDAAGDRLADALMAANADLDRQQAEAAAQAQVTEEAKKAYQEATAALDAYARQQNDKYTDATLYCSLDFDCALTPGMSISCNFGDPDGIDGSPHGGTDFPAGKGTPIYAVADGIVSAARAMSSYGNCVQISHGTADDGHNYATLYAHMSSIAVSQGQTVSKGQVIGYVGNTGAVSGKNGGYHLHLELRIDATRVNAMNYIPH